MSHTRRYPKCAHRFASWKRWESSRGAWMVYECHHCPRWLATEIAPRVSDNALQDKGLGGGAGEGTP